MSDGIKVELVTPWVECEYCDEYWCNIHEEHAFECPCPTIDDWTSYDLWPYDEMELEQAKHVISECLLNEDE